MSQIAASHSHSHDHGHEAADLSPGNTTWTGGAGLSIALLVVGAIGIALTVAGGFSAGVKHALAAYHVGAMTCLAMGLGALFWVMAFHLTQAGWSVTIRRQFENIMILLPVGAVMVLPVLIIELWQGGHLFAWLTYTKPDGIAAGDVLLEHKLAFLNPMFFFIRALIYIGLWSFLAWRLWGLSKEQDATGDKWLTNKARFTSSWGMPLFAITTAFASFDWLMSMDYRFFSTMWGVYFFAGAAFTAVPVVVIILNLLRSAGKLKGLVTAEHIHDLAKLMFGFTVFWAYIAFSQYFLIWYAAIPEETSFFLARKTDGWENLSKFLVFAHFLLPFFILLWRPVRRSFALLTIMAVWAIGLEVIDLYWIVRPFVYATDPTDKIKLGLLWIDIAGAVGPLALFLGLIIHKVRSGPLIPTHDPRLPEAIAHKNYV